MIVNINERLRNISAFIEDNSEVIDIGCDHGLLGIYLYQTKKNIRVVSSDIKKNPLLKAKDNLIKYHLDNKIELRLGNGLDCLDNKINTIIISGMGGITITEILKDIKKYPMVEKIVISPNNDFPLTRKFVSKLGFTLQNEVMVKENNKYYLISEYVKGKGFINNYFGNLDLSNEIVKEYIDSLYIKNNEILKSIPRKYVIKRLKLLIEQNNIRKKRV